MKKCCTCKASAVEFGPNKREADGLQRQCRNCQRSMSLASYHKNKTNKPHNRGHSLGRYWPELSPLARLDEYDRLIKSQRGQCAICLEAFKGAPHVDHDHATGLVRGLLCMQCNQAIGKFRDDTSILERAVAYLKGMGKIA